MSDKSGISLRLLLGAVLLLLLLLGAGCSLENGMETVEKPSEESLKVIQITEEYTYPPSQPLKFGFSQLGSESDWRLANTDSIIEAAEEAGIQLLFDNAEQSQTKQFEAIRGFIEQGVDVIVIAPVVHSGWDPILAEVKKAGIPVIIADRSIDVEDTSLYVTHIGSDFYEEGRKAGKYLLDKMRDVSGTIGIAELRGTEGSSPSIQRGEGFWETIISRDDFVMLSSETAGFTFEQGKQVMASFLEEHGADIQVLFAHNDDMALGAIEAIKAYGLIPGSDIVIISVDGTRKALEKLVAGELNFVIECNPLLGPNIVQAVQEIAAGRTLPKRIVPPESVFTQQMAVKEVSKRKY